MLNEEEHLRAIHRLTLENQKLLSDNNSLLKKMHRASIIGFWFRLLWAIFIIGIPFVLYFYIIEPYFTAMGTSFDEFRSGMQEIPGWKQFYESMQKQGGE